MPKVKEFCHFKFEKSTERSETTILGNLGTLDILGIFCADILAFLCVSGGLDHFTNNIMHLNLFA
jgi:hypothetical protein